MSSKNRQELLYITDYVQRRISELQKMDEAYRTNNKTNPIDWPDYMTEGDWYEQELVFMECLYGHMFG